MVSPNPQLPAEHRRWDALLRSLGMRDAPRPADLLALLADIALTSGGKPLDANERRAALRLLAALCNDADAAQARFATSSVHILPFSHTCQLS